MACLTIQLILNGGMGVDKTRRNALYEHAQPSARALLPHQVHLVLAAVVDPEFGGGA